MVRDISSNNNNIDRDAYIQAAKNLAARMDEIKASGRIPEASPNTPIQGEVQLASLNVGPSSKPGNVTSGVKEIDVSDPTVISEVVGGDIFWASAFLMFPNSNDTCYGIRNFADVIVIWPAGGNYAFPPDTLDTDADSEFLYDIANNYIIQKDPANGSGGINQVWSVNINIGGGTIVAFNIAYFTNPQIEGLTAAAPVNQNADQDIENRYTTVDISGTDTATPVALEATHEDVTSSTYTEVYSVGFWVGTDFIEVASYNTQAEMEKALAAEDGLDSPIRDDVVKAYFNGLSGDQNITWHIKKRLTYDLLELVDGETYEDETLLTSDANDISFTVAHNLDDAQARVLSGTSQEYQTVEESDGGYDNNLLIINNVTYTTNSDILDSERGWFIEQRNSADDSLMNGDVLGSTINGVSLQNIIDAIAESGSTPEITDNGDGTYTVSVEVDTDLLDVFNDTFYYVIKYRDEITTIDGNGNEIPSIVESSGDGLFLSGTEIDVSYEVLENQRWNAYTFRNHLTTRNYRRFTDEANGSSQKYENGVPVGDVIEHPFLRYEIIADKAVKLTYIENGVAKHLYPIGTRDGRYVYIMREELSLQNLLTDGAGNVDVYRIVSMPNETTGVMEENAIQEHYNPSSVQLHDDIRFNSTAPERGEIFERRDEIVRVADVLGGNDEFNPQSYISNQDYEKVEYIRSNGQRYVMTDDLEKAQEPGQLLFSSNVYTEDQLTALFRAREVSFTTDDIRYEALTGFLPEILQMDAEQIAPIKSLFSYEQTNKLLMILNLMKEYQIKDGLIAQLADPQLSEVDLKNKITEYLSGKNIEQPGIDQFFTKVETLTAALEEIKTAVLDKLFDEESGMMEYGWNKYFYSSDLITADRPAGLSLSADEFAFKIVDIQFSDLDEFFGDLDYVQIDDPEQKAAVIETVRNFLETKYNSVQDVSNDRVFGSANNNRAEFFLTFNGNKFDPTDAASIAAAGLSIKDTLEQGYLQESLAFSLPLALQRPLIGDLFANNYALLQGELIHGWQGDNPTTPVDDSGNGLMLTSSIDLGTDILSQGSVIPFLKLGWRSNWYLYDDTLISAEPYSDQVIEAGIGVDIETPDSVFAVIPEFKFTQSWLSHPTLEYQDFNLTIPVTLDPASTIFDKVGLSLEGGFSRQNYISITEFPDHVYDSEGVEFLPDSTTREYYDADGNRHAVEPTEEYGFGSWFFGGGTQVDMKFGNDINLGISADYKGAYDDILGTVDHSLDTGIDFNVPFLGISLGYQTDFEDQHILSGSIPITPSKGLTFGPHGGLSLLTGDQLMWSAGAFANIMLFENLSINANVNAIGSAENVTISGGIYGTMSLDMP